MTRTVKSTASRDSRQANYKGSRPPIHYLQQPPSSDVQSCFSCSRRVATHLLLRQSRFAVPSRISGIHHRRLYATTFSAFLSSSLSLLSCIRLRSVNCIHPCSFKPRVHWPQAPFAPAASHSAHAELGISSLFQAPSIHSPESIYLAPSNTDQSPSPKLYTASHLRASSHYRTLESSSLL